MRPHNHGAGQASAGKGSAGTRMKQEKSCGAVIYRRKDNKTEYLLVQNRRDKGGWWGFPKGHVREGETERETALREVEEETGLNVRIIDGFSGNVQYSPSPGAWKTVIFFVAEADTTQKPKRSEEANAFEWLKFDEAREKATFNETKELLSAADHFLATRHLQGEVTGRP